MRWTFEFGDALLILGTIDLAKPGEFTDSLRRLLVSLRFASPPTCELSVPAAELQNTPIQNRSCKLDVR